MIAQEPQESVSRQRRAIAARRLDHAGTAGVQLGDEIRLLNTTVCKLFGSNIVDSSGNRNRDWKSIDENSILGVKFVPIRYSFSALQLCIKYN